MGDASGMAIPKTLHNLPDNPACIFLSESSLLLGLQVAMQWPSTHILHDKDDIFTSVNDFIKLHDMLVSHLLHQLNFSLDRFSSVGLFKFIFLVNLEGYFFIRGFVKADSNHSVGTLAYLFSYDVLVQSVFGSEAHRVVEVTGFLFGGSRGDCGGRLVDLLLVLNYCQYVSSLIHNFSSIFHNHLTCVFFVLLSSFLWWIWLLYQNRGLLGYRCLALTRLRACINFMKLSSQVLGRTLSFALSTVRKNLVSLSLWDH